jgi:hypothetical protein
VSDRVTRIAPMVRPDVMVCLFALSEEKAMFNQLDRYVWRRLLALRIARNGRNIRPGEVARWSNEPFHNLALYRLRGTVRYPASLFWELHNAAA